MATADSSGISAPYDGRNQIPKVETELTWWGELHYGPQSALQSLGLGVDQTFPEKEGKPHALHVSDPRGLPCEISVCTYKPPYKGMYVARIHYPGRTNERPREDVAPGVIKQESVYGDHFIGSAKALVAAGLVEAWQLPGMPGMRKMRVLIQPDGKVYQGHPNANPPNELKGPGSKHIEKRGKIFEVQNRVASDVASTRLKADDECRKRWMNAPRPPMLQGAPTLSVCNGHNEDDAKEIKRLKRLPQSKEALKKTAADDLWKFTNLMLKWMKADGGYRYTDEAIQDFQQAMQDIYWTLLDADVEGQSTGKALQSLMLKRARSDESLQVFLRQVGGAS